VRRFLLLRVLSDAAPSAYADLRAKVDDYWDRARQQGDQSMDHALRPRDHRLARRPSRNLGSPQMARVLLALLAAALLLPAAARADVALPAGFSESAPWSRLDDPTALRFAPDGHVYVTGKGGLVYQFDGVSDPTPAIYADLRTKVHHGWDRGMLGLAVDSQSRVFVSYTYDKAPGDALVPRWNDGCPDPPGFLTEGCTVMGRLSRLDADGTEHVLLEDFCNQFPSHSIGTLQFGPDGMLYMGAGDGAHYDRADYGQSGIPVDPCSDSPGVAQTPPGANGGGLRAQSFRGTDPQIDSLDGTIMRLNPDTGAAALGNPAGGSPDPRRQRIVAYGFRNPFRFTFRPGTTEIWAGDVGWAAWEEIDRIPDATRVRNYGWPCWEGNVHQDSYDALNLDLCTSLYGDASAIGPYYTYRHGLSLGAGDTCKVGVNSSLSGIAFYTGAMFPPAYRDALFFADYSRTCIWVMRKGANGLPDPSTLQTFASGSFPVDLQVGPDGALYYPDIATGSIRRIAYDEPVATIAASGSGRTFRFEGSGGVTYAWDLDGDGAYDDSTQQNPSFTYAHDGPVTVRLRVTDARGASGFASKAIQVGTPPDVRIDAPAAGTTWSVGDAIAFAGTGPNLRWDLVIHHCARADPESCHVHHVQDFTGASGSFVAPDHEYPSYLELTATATDANGLTSSTSRRLNPKTAEVTMASSPPGLRLSFVSEVVAAPFTRTVISCSATTVTAPSPQSLGAATYAFGGWNDGFAQTREVRAPSSGSATYTASFAGVADTLLAGTQAVGPNVSSAWPGGGEAYRTTATATGPALALRLRLDQDSTATRLVMGLYTEADADASALLGTGTLANPVAGAWNEVRLDAPVQLVAGRRYWIALLNPFDGVGVLRWRDQVPGTPDYERTSQSKQLTALPAVWATQFAYPTGGPASAGAVGRPASAPLGGPVSAPACVKPQPAPEPTTVPAPAPTPQPKPNAKPLPRLTAPSRLTRRAGKVAISLTCPPVATCRFTVKLGARSASKTVKAGKRATVKLKAPKARRAKLTITRRVGTKTDRVTRYALISGRAGAASRATKAA
jgi:glucose/arabinose dehydrogenase/PKD repeat protein